MMWAKLDDTAHVHRKHLKAGLHAVGFWTMALSWCSRYGTDGHIPRDDVGTIYARVSQARAVQLATKLVSVGLFEETPDGWVIHDFLDYNPTAEAVAQVAHTRAQAGRSGGKKSGEVRRRHAGYAKHTGSNGEAMASANAKHTGSNGEAKTNPVPVPVPVPVPELLPNGPSHQDGPLRGGSRRPRRPPPGGGVTVAVWEAYAAAYADRYGTSPVRNRRVNGQLAHLVERLGATDAPLVAAWYVRHGGLPYVRAKHAVGLLLAHCEGLHTEWVTGRVITETQARQADRTATNRETLALLLADREAREKPP